VSEVEFRGRRYLIKRDDLLQPFPGNKARKLRGLLDLDWSRIRSILSHGGNQSNAMLALAHLAQLKGVAFQYYTPPLPGWLRAAPQGNLEKALALGMELREGRGPPDVALLPEDSLFVPQGVAMAEAEQGLMELAAELDRFAQHHQLSQPILFVASGTGTTAAYLHRHLGFPVVTTPCVGDGAYLRRQISTLTPNCCPAIVDGQQKARFGQPDPTHLALWQELHDSTGIEFDLLYDPPGWNALLKLDHPGDAIYLHCGGTEGNPSMLSRYRRGRIGGL
jgi:1-aminocyclopropane-1-carboxylate deaminase/D-cysteine desulfhydrase-like pyridoxal-dependent ACC family enzyme